MPCKVWDELTPPFPILQRLYRWCFGTDNQFNPTLYDGCDYESMLGLMLINVSKMGPGIMVQFCFDAINPISPQTLKMISLLLALVIVNSRSNLCPFLSIKFKISTLIRIKLMLFLRIHLTYWGRDKTTAISQMTFSNGFSWMKIYEFSLKCHNSFS